MATKTITITEEAYGKLKLKKKRNESFSDVINRTMPYTKITDFIGILSKESAQMLRESVEESKKSWDEPLKHLRRVKIDSRH